MTADDETRGNFIPLELWKLMDELHRRGMGSTTMFRAQGVEQERIAIIGALDGGIDGSVQVWLRFRQLRNRQKN